MNSGGPKEYILIAHCKRAYKRIFIYRDESKYYILVVLLDEDKIKQYTASDIDEVFVLLNDIGTLRNCYFTQFS